MSCCGGASYVVIVVMLPCLSILFFPYTTQYGRAVRLDGYSTNEGTAGRRSCLSNDNKKRSARFNYFHEMRHVEQ